MTKELQEFKERCLGLNCRDINSCKDCPFYDGNYDCIFKQFKRIVRERFKPKPEICPTCGKEK